MQTVPGNKHEFIQTLFSQDKSDLNKIYEWIKTFSGEDSETEGVVNYCEKNLKQKKVMKIVK